ncbi:MAG TPA: hypothetical protein PLV42_01350 [bacterium]|nr:hypothetical protein [bacterium]
MDKRVLYVLVGLLILLVACEEEKKSNDGFDWDLPAGDKDQTVTDGDTDDQNDDLIDTIADDPLTDGDELLQSDDAEIDEDGSDDGADQGNTDTNADTDTANDDTGSDELLSNDIDAILATNHRPVADAGPDLSALIAYTVTIDGSKSYDFDQDEIAFHWTILVQPEGSDIELDLTDPKKPFFTPLVKGIYEFSLRVDDGKEYSQIDEISISVADYVPINFEIVDSAYSKSLDSIIFVSEEPENALYIFDIEAQTLTTVSLPLIPISLSISPDGNEAVVGHYGYFSHINLVGGLLMDTYEAQTIVYDIVFGANNSIYVFPQTSKDLIVFNAIDGTEKGRFEDFGSDARAVRHPTDERLFVIQGGAIILLDISVMPPEKLSKLESEFPIGDDLWIAENGSKIFTKSGSIFSSSDFGDTNEDLLYQGRLEELETVKHLHNLGAVGRTVAIPDGGDDIQLNLYADPLLSYEKTIKLPTLNFNQTEHQYHGEVVYFNQDDTKIITVLSATVGTVDNYALVILEDF